ncbi:hypothetical protein M5X04_14530 [Paenibacillus alvei]|uniref:Uncharacterized protein n=1 Tax=Paenibacillus alvei TaxID=44250 RepID=A0ABT4E9W4_PAEAL|nr:hypothetical protein [Paenibacillus alvei]MCY9530535.1 hypothetical protein [Paenibacillus alvei]
MNVQISLTDFVDFVIKTGPPRLTKVKEVKNRDEYHPAFDFWKPLRDGLEVFHKQEKDFDYLYNIALKQKDSRKRTKYPLAINTYKKFIGRKQVKWFDPPKSKWLNDGLIVNINPELGLYINNVPHVIKLFFKDDKLDKRKTEVVFCLMQDELSSDAPPGAVMSILDIREGRLITPTKPPDDIFVLLKAEANTFIQIWNAL